MRESAPAHEDCPTGILEDIRIRFVHYGTFAEARDKWFDRAKRVDMDNLFLMLAQRDGCTAEDVRRFDLLPYEHKVAFVAEPMADVSCAQYVPEFSMGGGQVSVLSEYTSKLSGRRVMDAFDYVGFLNGR